MKRILSSIICFLTVFNFCLGSFPGAVFANEEITEPETKPEAELYAEPETEPVTEERKPNVWNGDKIAIPIAAGNKGYTLRAVYAKPYHAYEMSNHMVSTNGGVNNDIPQTLILVDATSSYTWTPNGLFNPNTSNYRVLYCCDAVTGYNDGVYYKRLNLEDSSYYTPESASHIRSIVSYSYPFVDLDVMKTRLKADGFAEADKLTRAEIITAVQSSIWAYANTEEGIYVYSQTFDVPSNSQWGGVVHDYTNEMDVWWKVGYRKFSKDEEVQNRINSLISFLISLEGVTAGRDEIIITGLNIEDCVPVAEKDGVYTAALKLNLNTSGNDGDSVDINVYVGEQLYTTCEVVPGIDSYNIVVQAEAGETIKVVVSGKQYIAKGVYFYEAEGGRDISQSLVDIASGETDVYCEAEVELPEIPDGPKANVTLYKTDDNGVALSGVTFDLYVMGQTEYVYVDTYSVDDNGVLALVDLVPGTYSIREKAAPGGYHTLNGDIQFTVTDEGEVETVSLPTDVTLNGDEGTYTITVVNIPEFTSVSGEKTWDDEDDFDGLRPESITINLLANDVVVDSKTVTEDDGWKWTFTDLPTIVDGNRIVYTISEDAVEHYETVIDGYNVTNKHVPEDVEVSGKKTWVDDNNRDRVRPTSIIVNLLADGEIVQTKTVTEADGWAWSFTELPMYKDGELIEYSVSEEPVEDYITSVEGYDITNTHEPEKVFVEGSKTWNDDNNRDGIRPLSITINLLADNVVVQTKTVTEADSWAWKFTNLPKYNDGVEIVYTITEDEVTGYISEIVGYNAINSYEPEKINIEGGKTWVDDDNHDGLRPRTITVNLLADNVVIRTVTVGEDTGWAWSFTDLYKYRDGGIEIVYTITEEAVVGYTARVEGFNITNTHEPAKVDVSGAKTWNDDNDRDGIRPGVIIINLLADGEIIQTKFVTAIDNFAWSFNNLPKYHRGGVEIKYTITEEPVAGYTSKINGYDVTNTHKPGKTFIEVEKAWRDLDNQDGIRPDYVIVKLLANGVDTGKEVVLSSANNWKAAFRDLYVSENGSEIKYTVEEIVPEGYTAFIEGSATLGYKITNVHTPEQISIPVEKIWNDDDNRDGFRPGSITVILYADGVDTGMSAVLDDYNNWKAEFTNLEAKRNGDDIVYTIEEVSVEGYRTEISGNAEEGFRITNTHTPEKTSIRLIKEWDDDNNSAGNRPDSVLVRLLADGVDTGIVAVISAANGWTATIDDLDVYKDGKKINYTVVEVVPDGYHVSIVGNATNGFVITNSHEAKKTEISGRKTWDDNNNRLGMRPESITINLLANGVVVDTKVVTEADGWAWTFEELDVYANGYEIVYTITEEAVPGYETTYVGYDVVNTSTYEPAKINIPVTKIWEDFDNAMGIRPTSITVELVVNGVASGKTLTISAANNWAASFTNLPVVDDDGNAIQYNVIEIAVESYVSKVEGSANFGFVVTNTYTEEIEEDPVPLSPVTGDHIFMLAVTLAFSAAAFVVTSNIKKKEQR